MSDITYPHSAEDALQLDASDPLAERRKLFKLPDGVTYLVGHSLGPTSKTALERVTACTEEEWGEGLVRSWNSAGWIDLGSAVGARIAPLIGVDPADVVVCDSVSVNLFKLAVAALGHVRTRTISIEDDTFPTDQYIADGAARATGALLRRVPGGGAIAALSEGGVLIKSAVNYRSGLVADIATVEREARARGAMVVWDLSHAVGVIPLKLQEEGALLAAGCTYKYVNGGPGAPAFVYAHRSISVEMRSPIQGWLGHAAPFTFDGDYQPADGVVRFVAGTPGILSMSALDGALAAFDGVDLNDCASKARSLGELCLMRGEAAGLIPASPPPHARGGHVSLRHAEGYAIVQALAAQGVLADFRTPDTIRFGLSPLYLSYADVWRAMDVLEAIMAERTWDRPEFKTRAKVT
ncbi:MAG: aminotransferase class V-fold PLP-dependent enzyme [Pseudomonadota bacterium]